MEDDTLSKHGLSLCLGFLFFEKISFGQSHGLFFLSFSSSFLMLIFGLSVS